MISRMGQFSTRLVQRRQSLRLRWIEPCQREEHIAIKSGFFPVRESKLNPVIRRPFADQSLRTEQWKHRIFNPAIFTEKITLYQNVPCVVSGIAFMAPKIDSSVDDDRQVRIDLNQADIIALVPVVPTPWLVGNIPKVEAFTVWQAIIFQCTPTTFRNGGVKHV